VKVETDWVCHFTSCNNIVGDFNIISFDKDDEYFTLQNSFERFSRLEIVTALVLESRLTYNSVITLYRTLYRTLSTHELCTNCRKWLKRLTHQ
jgi:hypothetical protein